MKSLKYIICRWLNFKFQDTEWVVKIFQSWSKHLSFWVHVSWVILDRSVVVWFFWLRNKVVVGERKPIQRLVYKIYSFIVVLLLLSISETWLLNLGPKIYTQMWFTIRNFYYTRIRNSRPLTEFDSNDEGRVTGSNINTDGDTNMTHFRFIKVPSGVFSFQRSSTLSLYITLDISVSCIIKLFLRVTYDYN